MVVGISRRILYDFFYTLRSDTTKLSLKLATALLEATRKYEINSYKIKVVDIKYLCLFIKV